ncbi:hypothetical protein GCM10009105_18090 [Dokdonella soli]|uniref:Uncharacterized protein n=1 Tax=Dokdonella soli TaxID=529810 RepID=A0ABN1II15_9GAMM
MLNVLLVVVGLLFVAYALRGQVNELASEAIAMPTWIYPVVILLATATVVLTAALHSVVVSTIATPPPPPARVRYAYAASQVARYVPGKVFGVILETQLLAPALDLRQVISATLVQTLLTYAWAGIGATIVLCALATHSTWMLTLMAPVLALLWLTQRRRWLERILSSLMPRLGSIDKPVVSIAVDRHQAWRGTTLLAVQWVPFFAMWVLLSDPGHGMSAACWLGASYLLASIGGSLLVLIPSGLVVREAAFLWLGGLYGLPAASLMTWAIVVRLALTIADVLTLPLLWAAAQRRPRE